MSPSLIVILAALGQFPSYQPASVFPSFAPLVAPAEPVVQPSITVLAFTSAWCGPCARMKPVLEALESEGVTVRRIDYDKQRSLALVHKVTTLPTTIVIKEGVEVARRVGVMPLDDARAMLKSARSRSAEVEVEPAKYRQAQPEPEAPQQEPEQESVAVQQKAAKCEYRRTGLFGLRCVKVQVR